MEMKGVGELTCSSGIVGIV